MKKKAVDQQIIRKTNQHLILEILRNEKHITRAALTKKLALSPPSVSSNIEKLLNKGILVEKGIDENPDSKLGRRGMLLQLNNKYMYMIGVDLSSEKLRIALGDLSGDVIEYEEMDLIEDKKANEIYEEIACCIDKILETNLLNKTNVGVIVIGSPGVINEESGELKFAPQFQGWEEINIKELIENKYQTKVIVKNDVNISAIGENRYGWGKDVDDLVYISVDLGVGAGIVINNKVYEGNNLAAGEIGYFITDKKQLTKPKSKYGFLEDSISVPRIIRKIARMLDVNKEEITIEKISQLYRERNKVVVEVIEDLAKEISMVIINSTILLDIELIVIGGRITNLEVELLEKIRGYVNNISPITSQIEYSRLKNESGIKGAFVIGLEYLFEHIIEK